MDEKTGLPELPEGYFWRVSRHGVTIMERLGPSSWEPSDRLSTKSNPLKEYRDRVVRRGWWRRPLVIHDERFINQMRQVHHVFTEPLRDEKGDPKEIPNGYGGYTTARHQITAADLPSLTQRALDEWEAIKASKALLGDYPPKRFEPEV